MSHFDPNVIYGGDIEVDLTLMGDCKSLGALLMRNLTMGGDKVVVVRLYFTRFSMNSVIQNNLVDRWQHSKANHVH